MLQGEYAFMCGTARFMAGFTGSGKTFELGLHFVKFCKQKNDCGEKKDPRFRGDNNTGL